MQFSKTVIAVLATAFVCDAASETGGVGRVLEVISKKGNSHLGRSLHGRRDEVSAQCLSDTEALLQNTDIVAVAENLITACAEYMSVSETPPISVVIDWTDCPAAKDFQGTCTAAGGQPYVAPGLKVSCSGAPGESLTIEVAGLPDCVAQSCNLANIQEQAGGILQEVESQIEAVFGAECEVNPGSPVPVPSPTPEETATPAPSPGGGETPAPSPDGGETPAPSPGGADKTDSPTEEPTMPPSGATNVSLSIVAMGGAAALLSLLNIYV